MSAQKPPDAGRIDSEQEKWPEPDPEELRLLEEHLDHLEKEGVLIKGDGIRGSLRRDEAETINTAGHESVEKSDELRQMFKQLAELRAQRDYLRRRRAARKFEAHGTCAGRVGPVPCRRTVG